MKVEVRLFASFTKYLPDDAEGQKVILDLAEGTTVKQVLVQLRVPLEEIKLVFINSVHAEIEDVLKDGDRMGAFPPVGGG
ncbi:MAG: MoaD/ThiS family protein [Deltaproteobacteria bacterium]|jgi:sulfur-carrier protein|nr:MoaD/ThiS family protein [Deltaproteobacteria bacterium]MBT4641515.1 MoaD/ThiS family protein [Deltaproteobacteria bacterium]MBT6499960.1 MoaD/ThiS family protein [Deltaproteobacteria bacterium]